MATKQMNEEQFNTIMDRLDSIEKNTASKADVWQITLTIHAAIWGTIIGTIVVAGQAGLIG